MPSTPSPKTRTEDRVAASRNSVSLKSLSRPIDRLLWRLRSRIRWFVLLEGIAIAIIWAVLTFWIALAIDYLPVTMGFNELSRPARLIILVLSSLAIAYVLYRLVFRRVFVRLQNQSMAMLIERRYPQFNDSLLTTVSRTNSRASDVPVDEAMLERTRINAEAIVPEVDLAKVINSNPLKRSFAIAGLLLLTVAGFAVANPGAIKLAAQRLYLLKNDAWPRSCQIEIVGINIKRDNVIEGIDELVQLVKPTSGQDGEKPTFFVAKGATLTLHVRAQADQDNNGRRLPDVCSLIYQIEDGDRGTQEFKKIGGPRNGFQRYSLDGQPFSGILSSISFEVRGGDHRLGPFEISVVDEPTVLSTDLVCKYPSYLVDEFRGEGQTIQWTGQARLPQGTGLTIKATANNKLTNVYVSGTTIDKPIPIKPSGNQFEFSVPAIKQPVDLEFTLCDANGLISQQPHRILIDSIEDQPPLIRSRLKGIGTAVTPDVQIPFEGTIDDDYGLAKSWVEIEIAKTETITEPVTINKSGELECTIDFRQRKQTIGKQYELPTGENKGENKVSFVIKSQDKFDLENSTNIGVGDRYVLDIVSPNELVRILERLEVGQRRRLEQIYLELSDTRNYLQRSKSKLASKESANDFVEPGEETVEPENDTEENEIRKQEMRLLFAQRSIVQIDKSTHEILGSAEAFDSIRLQLINNRIDSEDRKARFTEQIIAPLRLIGEQSMQQLRTRTVELESGLRDLQISPDDGQVSEEADRLANSAIEQTELTLKQLDAVLDVLLKYETQNELLEIVRGMIKDQQELKDRTKKERQRKAFEGLLD